MVAVAKATATAAVTYIQQNNAEARLLYQLEQMVIS